MKKYLALLAATFCCGLSLTAAPGAIWTTYPAGDVVNGNIYAADTEVYLNGGPGAHAKCTVAGLPDGDYFFAVTDPSNNVLLSTDSADQRKFRVTSGKITAYLGSTHITGINPCGGVTIALAPFARTPNPGGEYSVSVSPTAGFSPSTVKNDNFKIRTDANCLSKSVKVCISCPENIIIPCDQVNASGVVVNFADPIVLPAIGTSAQCFPPSGTLFPVGTTTVLVVATDSRGRTATCSFTVTVGNCPRFDLVCPADIVACAAGSGVCTATGLFAVPAGNELVTVTSTHTGSTEFPLGVTPVTFTSSQGDRVLSTCTFNVTVNDCSVGVICGHVNNTDNGLPIAGWKLSIGNWTGYTDNTGAYCFSSLPPGTYTITQTPPVGCWVNTTATSRTFTVSCENVSNHFDAYFGEVCRCAVQY